MVLKIILNSIKGLGLQIKVIIQASSPESQPSTRVNGSRAAYRVLRSNVVLYTVHSYEAFKHEFFSQGSRGRGRGRSFGHAITASCQRFPTSSQTRLTLEWSQWIKIFKMVSSIFQQFQSQIRSLQTSLDNSSIPWKPLVLTLLTINFLFDFYISLRQYPKYSLPTPPAQLVPHVDLETFNKSQKYGKAKAKFAFFSGILGFVESIIIVHYDVLAIVWNQAGMVLYRMGWEDTEVSEKWCGRGRREGT